MKEYRFFVNGLEVRASYREEDIEEIFIPLLKRFTRQAARLDGRMIVFLAAPPGVGKTTLAQFLESISRAAEEVEEIQAVGLDGFHYHQDYILSHRAWVMGESVPMKDVKGCPETFDVEHLTDKLKALQKGPVKWPVYDRTIHDVIEDQIEVERRIVLIEGNWLLHQEGAWKQLKSFCQDSIFLSADEALLKERLIGRKMAGGKTYEEALAFYQQTDGVNVRRALERHALANIELNLLNDGTYVLERGVMDQ